MAQLILTLAVVAGLVYFVLFRTGTDTETGKAEPYAAEVQKAEDVQLMMQDGQQLRQQQIDEQDE